MGESRRRPGQRVPPDEIDRFVAERLSGRTRAEACRVVGVSPSWAANFERERLDPSIRARLPKDRRGRPITGDVAAPLVARPLAAEALTSEAQRSLEDFGFFRVRFFGRVPSPWQEEAAYTIRDLLASPDKEFVVLNCPPGAGKSTLLHDVMCWLIARDRSVRLLYSPS